MLLAAPLAAVALAATPATASAAPNWDAIIACESEGKNVPNRSGSSASGYFQIIDGTWKAHGGGKYSSRAMGATRAQQQEIANRIAAKRGSLADWNASKKCWGGKAGAVTSRKADKPSQPKTVRVAGKNVSGSAVPDGYRVKRGDTLGKLAKRFDTSVSAIASANGIANPNRIAVGQRLR